MANATRTISGDPLWVSRNKRDPEALIFASGSLLFLLLAQNQPLKGRLDTCLDIQELKDGEGGSGKPVRSWSMELCLLPLK